MKVFTTTPPCRTMATRRKNTSWHLTEKEPVCSYLSTWGRIRWSLLSWDKADNAADVALSLLYLPGQTKGDELQCHATCDDPATRNHAVTQPDLIGHSQVKNSPEHCERARGIFWGVKLFNCVWTDLPDIVTWLKRTCRRTSQSDETKSNPVWWLVDSQGYLNDWHGLNAIRMSKSK